jgi:hypothetical protein
MAVRGARTTDTRIIPQIIHSGNIDFHSDGCTSMRSGNLTFHSDGYTIMRIGNMFFDIWLRGCISVYAVVKYTVACHFVYKDILKNIEGCQ